MEQEQQLWVEARLRADTDMVGTPFRRYDVFGWDLSDYEVVRFMGDSDCQRFHIVAVGGSVE